MAEKESLSLKDQQSVYDAILNLILSYDNYPLWFKANNQTVRWGTMTDGTAIGLYPAQNSYYLSKYVNGNYKALLSFTVMFACNYNQTNREVLEITDFLTDLALFVENASIEFTDDKVFIRDISRQTPVYIAEQNEKRTIYAINFAVRFNNKKNK